MCGNEKAKAGGEWRMKSEKKEGEELRMKKEEKERAMGQVICE